MGRQNVPRDQWLELGYECPHCGEQLTEADVFAWRPMPEDPKLLLLWCPELRRPRRDQPHLSVVPPRGFEPLISTLKGWRPRPLDDGGADALAGQS